MLLSLSFVCQFYLGYFPSLSVIINTTLLHTSPLELQHPHLSRPSQNIILFFFSSSPSSSSSPSPGALSVEMAYGTTPLLPYLTSLFFCQFVCLSVCMYVFHPTLPPQFFHSFVFYIRSSSPILNCFYFGDALCRCSERFPSPQRIKKRGKRRK